MNVQTWIHDPEFVSDALSEQTKLFQKSQIDGKMQNSLAVKFDTDLWANYTDLTVTPRGTDDGATGASFDDIEDGITDIVSNDAERSDCVIVLSPKTLSGLIKDKILASGDYTMSRSMETGVVPVLAGCPVFMSNNLPTTANGSKVNLVLHKEALAFAIAREARVRSQMTLDYLGETIVGDMLYGSKVYRPNAGIAIYGK
jgi:HK97 family phage major capsid protein